jgi:iron only hydrogenase large subunit-like protein
MKKEMKCLKFPLKDKWVAMLAPSFIVDFSYPKIIYQLKDLGVDKVVELTFGAKMINRDYQKCLNKSKNLVIASVCPGIVETIKSKHPSYKKNLILVDSPMFAMAKICKKAYPTHKVLFISPCTFKGIEAQSSKDIDYVLDYQELKEIFDKFELTKKKYPKKPVLFDKFYNDYTKIYPLSGGLSKTAHLKGTINNNEVKIIDGMNKIDKFLNKPNKKIRFLDVTFCKGGCIGGPKLNSRLPLLLKKRKLLKYMRFADKEKIPVGKKGILKEAEGISFKSDYLNK